MNKYFKTSDAKNFAFYKVPKALFEEKYKSVSTDAKMLYGLLLDRMYLSVKNGWIDKQGRVYQYFTRYFRAAMYKAMSVILSRIRYKQRRGPGVINTLNAMENWSPP